MVSEGAIGEVSVSHPATKKDRTAHGFDRDDIHPYGKECRGITIVVKLDGHVDLSVRSE